MNDSSADPQVAIEGLRILCFDGGGVRGKASLLLLKEIMDNIGQGAKPCDFFDLIAGTSTGGLIAIMLARLEYTVEEVIKKYDALGPRIFSRRASDDTWIIRGTPLVPEGPAEEAFQEIGHVNGEDAFMDSGHNNSCKCFVTTVLQDRPGVLVPIRSYPSTDRADPVTSSGKQWKIWEAARAVTAAPVYFKPFELAGVPGRIFIDAGAGYNNPSSEVYHEIAVNITEYKDKPIVCFVSIGTGARSQPAPSDRNDSFRFRFTSLLGPARDRAADLINYLADIASNPAKVHNEMKRAHEAHGFYFRFDPGSRVGSIDLADASQLWRMGNLVWDHMQENRAIIKELRSCSDKLKAASFMAVQSLPLSRTDPDIEQLRHMPHATTSNRQSGDYGLASTLSPLDIRRDWLSIIELVDVAVDNPSAGSIILAIFSLSNNFEHVLEAFNAKYYSSTDTSGTQVCILMLVTKFVSNLWLTDQQISKISEFFVPTPHPLPHSVAPHMAFQQSFLIENLRIAESRNASGLEYTVSTPDDLKVFAKELAEALAVLEDSLRRSDPVCECVRWLARRSSQDFLSFPDRVKCWVLRSILDAEVADIKRRYQLFYKVAKVRSPTLHSFFAIQQLVKRSKDIHNFSAMRAILSALHFLEKIRIGTQVKTTDLRNMMRIDYAQMVQWVQRSDKPYLHSLQDIVPSRFVDLSTVADSRQQINWFECQKLLSELETFTSRQNTRFTSPSEYVISWDRVVGFVRKSLINATVVDNIEGRVRATMRRYKEAQPKPPRLWRK